MFTDVGKLSIKTLLLKGNTIPAVACLSLGLTPQNISKFWMSPGDPAGGGWLNSRPGNYQDRAAPDWNPNMSKWGQRAKAAFRDYLL